MKMRLSIATLVANALLIPFTTFANQEITSVLDNSRDLLRSDQNENFLAEDYIGDLYSTNPGPSTLVLGKLSALYNPSSSSSRPNQLCVEIDVIGSRDYMTEPYNFNNYWVKVNGNQILTFDSSLERGFGVGGQRDGHNEWFACYPVSDAPCSIEVGTTIYVENGDNDVAHAVSSGEITLPVNSGSPYVCGDPHLQSWGGMKWDYHGECDLVAIRNPDFANGKGLELHVRTTRDHHYSFTNEAALKIGDDVFEVHSLSEYGLNGEVGDYTNKTTDTIGGFPLSHWHSGSRDNLFFHRHVVDLGTTGEKIEIKTFENIVYVEIGGNRYGMFKGSTGLFGDADSGKLIGRDGETEYEPSDEYALEWQVRDTDPKLFSKQRAPIYPEKCYPPKKFIPRLGHLQAQKQAEELCAAWQESEKDSCVFDVMASGNKDLAQFKVMDAEAKAAEIEEQTMTTFE